MMPTEKIPSLQQFKKSEKDVIGGLCRYVSDGRSPYLHAAHCMWLAAIGIGNGLAY